MLHGGRLAAEGSASELKRRFGAHRLELTLRDAQSFAATAHRLGDRVTHRDPARLELAVATGGGAPEVRRLLDEVDPDRREIVRFAVREATLDDVFLTLTGDPVTARREVANV